MPHSVFPRLTQALERFSERRVFPRLTRALEKFAEERDGRKGERGEGQKISRQSLQTGGDSSSVSGGRMGIAGVARKEQVYAPLNAAADLAQWYSELCQQVEAAGGDAEAIAEEASAELAPDGWNVVHDGGRWRAIHDSEDEGGEEPEKFTEKAPKGGIDFNGKHYQGGQFIPNKEIASASPEDKAKLAAAKEASGKKQQAAADERRARGSVDAGKLKARLAQHARELSPQERKSAAAMATLYHRHHGELAMHRVEEIADRVERTLAGITDDHPNSEGLREQLGRKLAQLHDAAGRLGAKGVTGEVAKPESKPKKEKPAPAAPAAKPTPAPGGKPADEARSIFGDFKSAVEGEINAGRDPGKILPALRKQLVPRINALDLSGTPTAELKALAKGIPGADASGTREQMAWDVKRAMLDQMIPQAGHDRDPGEVEPNIGPRPAATEAQRRGKPGQTPSPAPAASVSEEAKPHVERVKGLRDEMMGRLSAAMQHATGEERVSGANAVLHDANQRLDAMNLGLLSRERLHDVARGLGATVGKAESREKAIEAIRHSVLEPLQSALPDSLGAPSGDKPGPEAKDHASAVLSAHDRLAKEHSGLVPLHKLHKAVGGSLADLHGTVNDLRRQGVLTGTQAEGRKGIDPELAAAAIQHPGGDAIHYVSRRQGETPAPAPAAKPTGKPMPRSGAPAADRAIAAAKTPADRVRAVYDHAKDLAMAAIAGGGDQKAQTQRYIDAALAGLDRAGLRSAADALGMRGAPAAGLEQAVRDHIGARMGATLRIAAGEGPKFIQTHVAKWKQESGYQPPTANHAEAFPRLSAALLRFSEGGSDMHRINKIELFADGEHRGKPYSADDLRDMVKNFDEYSRPQNGRAPRQRVPLVIGHDEDQEFLNRSDLPAAGWFERLYVKPSPTPDDPGRQGLFGDAADVPGKVARLIKSGAYRKGSLEIYPPELHPFKGQGMMARRFAALGGDIPQVKDLDDIPTPEPMSEPARAAGAGAAYLRFSRVLMFSEVQKMPLEEGKSRKTFEHNVAEMVNAGHPEKQSLAAAYRQAGEKNSEGGPMDPEELKNKMSEHGVDMEKCGGMAPEHMAECVRAMDEKDAQHQGDGMDDDRFDSYAARCMEEDMPEGDEEKMNSYRERAKKFAEFAKKYGERCKFAEDGTVEGKMRTPEEQAKGELPVKYSEAEKRLVALEKRIEEKAARVEKMTEQQETEHRKKLIDGALERLADRVPPAQRPGVRITLETLAGDATVHKFSEPGGKTFTGTHYDNYVRALERGPKVGTERLKLGGNAPADDRKAWAEQTWDCFSETFRQCAVTRDTFVKTAIAASDEQFAETRAKWDARKSA